MFLKISQNSLENVCARTYFLIKLQASGLQLYLKRGSGADVFLWILQIFTSTFFTEHLRTTASDSSFWDTAVWNFRKKLNNLPPDGFLDKWPRQVTFGFCLFRLWNCSSMVRRVTETMLLKWKLLNNASKDNQSHNKVVLLKVMLHLIFWKWKCKTSTKQTGNKL